MLFITAILTINVLTILLSNFYIYKKLKFEIDKKYNKYLTLSNNNVKELEHKLENLRLFIKIKQRCFIGIGGGGSNSIENINKIDNRHKFIHVDSNLQDLSRKTSKYKLLLGYSTKIGLGCGGKQECAKNLVTNNIKKQLYKLIQNEEKIYIVTTLGGGIGSTVTPELLDYLSTFDKEIFVFVTMPFKFEGKKRNSLAQAALNKIRLHTQNLVILENDNLIVDNKDIGVKEALLMSSNMIYKKILNEK